MKASLQLITMPFYVLRYEVNENSSVSLAVRLITGPAHVIRVHEVADGDPFFLDPYVGLAVAVSRGGVGVVRYFCALDGHDQTGREAVCAALKEIGLPHVRMAENVSTALGTVVRRAHLGVVQGFCASTRYDREAREAFRVRLKDLGITRVRAARVAEVPT